MDTTILLLLILGCLLAIPIVLWYITIIRKYQKAHNIPGPKPLPLIGNVLQIGTTNKAVFDDFWRFHKRYGSLFKLHLGAELVMVTSDADLAGTILTSPHVTKSSDYDLLESWLSGGLLLMRSPAIYKRNRKMITPTFHFKVLDQFLDTFQRHADVFVDNLWAKMDEDQCVDVKPLLHRCALNNIFETSMGVNLSDQKAEDNLSYVHALDQYLECLLHRLFSAWKRFELPFKLLSSEYKGYRQSLDTLTDFPDRLIRQRKEQLAQNTRVDSELSENRFERGSSSVLLDCLIESQKTHDFDDDYIRHEINTFLFAGEDTTTSALGFALLTLANEQSVQQKLWEEIDEIFPADTVDMSQVRRTTYLDLFLKESLRLYPAVTFVARKLLQDFQYGEFVLPKGAIIYIYMYGMHRSKEYFPNPEVFDIDRFRPENRKGSHPFCYIPFSAGPRNCIGQKYAMLQMKVLIVKILKTYRLLPALNGFKPEMGMIPTLRSLNGISIRLARRERSKLD